MLSHIHSLVFPEKCYLAQTWLNVPKYCVFFVQILTTASDATLGGRDFDEKLVEYFCNDFKVVKLSNNDFLLL